MKEPLYAYVHAESYSMIQQIIPALANKTSIFYHMQMKNDRDFFQANI